MNLTGDTNIKLAKPRDPSTKKYIDLLKRHHMTNVINAPTYHSFRTHEISIIDHFCTTDPDLYCQCGVCPSDESDHDLIYGARKKIKVKWVKVRKWARKYKNLNEIDLKHDIDTHDWSKILDNDNPTECWDLFVDDFNAILDKHAPWCKMTFDEIYHHG